MKNNFLIYAIIISVSGVFNINSVLADADAITPDAVVNLVVTNKTHDSVTLSWTAPGDDGNSGTAAKYDIRFSNSAIASDADFNAAKQVIIEPVPATAGTVQSAIVSSGYISGSVSSLAQNTQYYFGLKTIDEAQNVSSLSNVVSVITSAFSGAPAIPEAFYGSVVINGNYAPVGAVLLAQTPNGLHRGHTLLTQAGFYGGQADWSSKLTVYEVSGASEIRFWAYDPIADQSFESSQTSTFVAGELTNLDLMFGEINFASIYMIPDAASLLEGDVFDFYAQALDALGNAVDPQPEFTWISSDSNIATVDANGLVKGTGAGVVTITASSGVIAAVATLTVIGLPLTTPARSIALDIYDHEIFVGATTQYEAAVFNESGPILLPNPPITWESSDPAIASIDINGLATGLSPGHVLITASSLVSVSAILSVIGTPIVVNGSPLVDDMPVQNATPGTVVNFTVSAQDPDSDILDYSLFADAPQGSAINSETGEFSWLPPNPPVNNYDFYNFHILVSDGINLPVLEPIIIRVGNFYFAEIIISPSTAQVPIGASQQFIVTETLDQYGWPVQLQDPVFYWTVYNPITSAITGVGTIDNTGLFTALAEGTAIIRTAGGDAAHGNTMRFTSVSVVLPPPPVCETQGDEDHDGRISNLEILHHIRGWKTGAVSNLEILKTVRFWKSGSGC